MEEVTIDMPIVGQDHTSGGEVIELSPNNPQENISQTEAFPKDLSTQIPVSIPGKVKNIGGRPCEYCQREEEILIKTKKYLEKGKGEKPKMVYINELAMELDVYRDIVVDWKNKKKADGSLEHPTFNRMVKELEAIQELRLQQRLLGRYNATGAIFLLKTKHKYIETEKQILLGEKNAEPIKIEFIPEQKLPTNE